MRSRTSRAVKETPQPTMRGTDGMLDGPTSCREEEREGGREGARGGVNMREEDERRG